MLVQRFLKLDEVSGPFNSLDSIESDVEIAMLPPELTDEDEGDGYEVNSGEIIVTGDLLYDVFGCLGGVRTGDSFHPEVFTSSGCSTTKNRKKLKYTSHFG
ncbi:hypothetical protein TNCV_4014241 [Trichonephila clavipes]|nr:hypothetical protein TNCV_4014241 [Trichonephila clavipes]